MQSHRWNSNAPFISGWHGTNRSPLIILRFLLDKRNRRRLPCAVKATDGFGRGFGNVMALDPRHLNHRSAVSASTTPFHIEN